MRLEGKSVLVTGAAEGIGEAIARSFVDEGAFVIITDILHEKGRQIADELGEKAIYMSLNVAEEEQWNAVEKEIVDRGIKLNVLINNAGIIGFEGTSMPMNPEECTLEDWYRVHEVNLTGVFLGCKMAIRLMKEHGGSIVNISSRSGIVGVPSAAPYASSKAAERNHTKSVALHCAEQGYNIRCNSIHPATIMTPMWEMMLGTGDALEKAMNAIAATIPLKRFGEPMDVAFAAMYLASDESKYMTGSEIHIDGGILAGTASSPKKVDD